IVLTLVENLELENQALMRSDASVLGVVDHGDRLDEMLAALREGEATGTVTVRHYRIDTVDVSLIVPFGRQDGLSLGLRSTGTVQIRERDATGTIVEDATTAFATTFVMRRATGDRWLIVAEMPFDDH